MPTYTAKPKSGTLPQRNHTDSLVVSWAAYVAQLERDLCNAYWTDDEPEIKRLRNRLQIARGVDRQDDDMYVLF